MMSPAQCIVHSNEFLQELSIASSNLPSAPSPWKRSYYLGSDRTLPSHHLAFITLKIAKERTCIGFIEFIEFIEMGLSPFDGDASLVGNVATYLLASSESNDSDKAIARHCLQGIVTEKRDDDLAARLLRWVTEYYEKRGAVLTKLEAFAFRGVLRRVDGAAVTAHSVSPSSDPEYRMASKGHVEMNPAESMSKARLDENRAAAALVNRAPSRAAISAKKRWPCHSNNTQKGGEPRPDEKLGLERLHNVNMAALIDAAKPLDETECPFGGRMMRKMGWQPGDGLGTTGEGIRVPVLPATSPPKVRPMTSSSQEWPPAEGEILEEYSSWHKAPAMVSKGPLEVKSSCNAGRNNSRRASTSPPQSSKSRAGSNPRLGRNESREASPGTPTKWHEFSRANNAERIKSEKSSPKSADEPLPSTHNDDKSAVPTHQGVLGSGNTTKQYQRLNSPTPIRGKLDHRTNRTYTVPKKVESAAYDLFAVTTFQPRTTPQHGPRYWG